MNKKDLTYESALEELQTIVTELQDEMVSVDDLTSKVQRAKELLEFCKNKLRGVEGAIGKLIDN